MSKAKVLITAPVHQVLLDVLATDFTVDYKPEISYEQLVQTIHLYEGLVITTRLRIDKAIIDEAQSLKWIGRLGSGMELVDEVAAAKKGIQTISSPEGNANAVGEFAVGLLLSLLRKIIISNTEVKNHQWIRAGNRGIEIAGKTVGIIGYGNTGTAFSKVLQGFGAHVLAYDKYKQPALTYGVTPVGLDQILAEAHIISFHVPLTAETFHMANQSFFERAAKQPVIINTSRGKVVNTNDLIAALDNVMVTGACLDVLENEQISSLSPDEQIVYNNLVNRSNVIVTPHIAGYTYEAYYKMAKVLLKKVNFTVS